MLGARLAWARRRAKLKQMDLAVAMGERYDQTMISHVESGRSGLVADGIARAARALNTSADYLLGLTDDHTSARDRTAKSPTVDIVALNREAVFAGNGSVSTVVAEQSSYSFSRARLEESGIDPTRVSVFRVRGASMAPTLANGSLILVDYLRDVPGRTASTSSGRTTPCSSSGPSGARPRGGGTATTPVGRPSPSRTP